MSTKIETTINTYHRLPISDVPLNQPYQTREGNSKDSEARTASKGAFLAESSTLRWPEVELTRLNAAELKSYRSMLLGLLGDIDDAPEEISNQAKDVTYDSLLQKIEEINRHLSIARMMGNTSAAEWLGETPTEELRIHAAEQNLEIFGRPEIGRFNWFLAKGRRLATDKLSDPNELVRQKAQEFLNRTAPVDAHEVDAPLEWNRDVIRRLEEDFFAVFPGLEDYCDQDFPDTIPVIESLPYFNEMRDIVGLPDDEYDAYFSNRRAAEETPRGVAVGMKRRTPFDAKSITRLPFHEWLHVLRRHNARKQRKHENRLATRNNTSFEEAMCTLFEHALVGEQYTAGVDYYLSIGLLMGLDRSQDSHDLHQMRDFRDVSELLTILKGLQSGASSKEDFRKAGEKTYDTITRTTRGGALDARDLSYHAGDQRVKRAIIDIQHLPDAERRRMIMFYLSGQFDPTNASEAARFKNDKE